MSPECISCSRLGGCLRTDGQKLVAHFVCELYQEEPQEEIIRARLDVINKFGSAGIQSVISSDVQKED